MNAVAVEFSERARVRPGVREADPVVAIRREGDRHEDPEQPVRDPADDRAEPVARAEEEVDLGRRMDEQDGDGEADPEAVPGQPAPDPRPLAVAGRLVVLGGPEALGVEPKHHEEQRQPDGDQPPGEVQELFHERD